MTTTKTKTKTTVFQRFGVEIYFLLAFVSWLAGLRLSMTVEYGIGSLAVLAVLLLVAVFACMAMVAHDVRMARRFDEDN